MVKKFSEVVPSMSSGKTLFRAPQCWQILVSNAWNHSIITYQELADIMGIHRRPLNLILGYIMNYCVHNQLPPLTSIVVNQDTGVPGEGFTAEEAAKVPSQHIKVFRYNWFDLVPPTIEDFQQAHEVAHGEEEDSRE